MEGGARGMEESSDMTVEVNYHLQGGDPIGRVGIWQWKSPQIVEEDSHLQVRNREGEWREGMADWGGGMDRLLRTSDYCLLDVGQGIRKHGYR